MKLFTEKSKSNYILVGPERVRIISIYLKQFVPIIYDIMSFNCTHQSLSFTYQEFFFLHLFDDENKKAKEKNDLEIDLSQNKKKKHWEWKTFRCWLIPRYILFSSSSTANKNIWKKGKDALLHLLLLAALILCDVAIVGKFNIKGKLTKQRTEGK